MEKGLKDVRIEPEEIMSSDQDPVILSVYYPNVIETPGYIQPRVQIEIGCRSLREPLKKMPILSLIDEKFPEATVDHLYNEKFLKDIYIKADPNITTSVTVPILWDKKTHTIVNNESSQIIPFSARYLRLLP